MQFAVFCNHSSIVSLVPSDLTQKSQHMYVQQFVDQTRQWVIILLFSVINHPGRKINGSVSGKISQGSPEFTRIVKVFKQKKSKFLTILGGCCIAMQGDVASYHLF